jgi:hypothetical protein
LRIFFARAISFPLKISYLFSRNKVKLLIFLQVNVLKEKKVRRIVTKITPNQKKEKMKKITLNVSGETITHIFIWNSKTSKNTNSSWK